MSDDTTTPTDTPTDAPAGTPAPDPQATPTDTATPPEPKPNADTPKVFDEKYVSGLRNEAAGHRSKLRDTEAERDQFKTKFEELVKSFGTAAGLITDDTPPDPEQLTQQISATQAEAKQARVELAVYKLAGKPELGADPDALLDSTSFARLTSKLDPAADDFASQVEHAITAALQANPKLKAAPVVPDSSTGDPDRRQSDDKSQLTREELKKMSPADRLKAAREGRANALLGK